METLETIAVTTRQAAIDLGDSSAETRNNMLRAVEMGLAERAADIFDANHRDLAAAERIDLAAPLRKRLKFGPATLETLRNGIRTLIDLPDPLGRVLEARQLDDGLRLYRRSVPIGVLGIIFESRPDALVQISTLCAKSANAVLLKGGSEARETNRTLADIVHAATISAGAPNGWLTLLESRADVTAMLALDEWIDLIIPRGSNQFVRHIMDNTRIPVMGHADGVCHLYIDRAADRDMATDIAIDAKTQYVAVCNAIETILLHREIADTLLPMLAEKLRAQGVELRGCRRSQAIVADLSPANEADWSTEYLDLIVAIRIVDSIDEAIEHINHYGSHHTDAIVTDDAQCARRFMARVDSAGVFHNCSTRFADGYRYGLGAEVGIATGKLHARGPVGLTGLMSGKWFLYGSGQIVADYSGDNARRLTSLDLPLDLPLGAPPSTTDHARPTR